MSAAIVAYGAASALGVGRAAFDVGPAGASARAAWSSRAQGKPFGRVAELVAPRPERPRALLELGLRQVMHQLDALDPRWRGRKLGVAIGTASGGFAALEQALGGAPELLEHSSYSSPLRAVVPLLGATPARLVSLYGACASSTLALGLGLRWLELDEVELVIAGGYDAESDWVCAGFDALKATSAAAPRPFRAERDGMALGEGVALLALRREPARALGFVAGFGATSDAVHVTAPDRSGAGLRRAAQQALNDAEVPPSAVDFVSVHGTGTSFNDAAEAAALRGVFGAGADTLVLHAFKPSVGHTLGAAGALESLAALSALEHGVSPASLCPGTPLPELPGAALLECNVTRAHASCLKLSSAFGGANAALLLTREAATPKSRAPRRVYVAACGSFTNELEPSHVAASLVVPLERLPRSDALASLAVAAAGEVLRGSPALDRQRTGVIVGSLSATLQANADFGARILARGVAQAEPRRFPATSPNVCAGQVAIAFGLGGPSFAVGAGPQAPSEALAVARTLLGAGDAEAILVIAAEHIGQSAAAVLDAQGWLAPTAQSGAQAVLLSTSPDGVAWGPELEAAAEAGFSALAKACHAAGLPQPVAFGSVRPPE